MHVVFVDDGLDVELALRLDEQLVGERGAKRRHAPAPQILERAVSLAIPGAHGENFAELVIRDGDGEPGLAGGCVLEAAQADVEIAPDDGGVEAREPNLDETGCPAQLAREQRRDLDVEPDDARRIAWIGFDKWRASLGVAAPAELRRRLRAGVRCRQ
jgi:hypothetical protein